MDPESKDINGLKVSALPFAALLRGRIEDYDLMSFGGAWGREYVAHVEGVPASGVRMEQRRGRCASGIKPFWVLRNRKTKRGLGLALAWMGNWTFEVAPAGDRISVQLETSPSGLAPFDEVNGLPIPGVLACDFEGHWDDGCRSIVRFAQDKLLRDLGPRWPLVQFNTWYDDFQNLSEAKLLDSASRASKLGCELFVMDAGWYGGTTNAVDWNVGLGDWTVNRQRLPNGIEAIEQAVRDLGMKFGLWVEIECAHPESPIARQHPDWFLTDASGRRIGDRDVLDFGRPDVLAWAKTTLAELIDRYRLDYVKMDMNADLPLDDASAESNPLAGHYRGVAGMWRWIRQTWPDLIVENCSSGSLRQDFTAVALTDTHWVSDGVDHTLSVPYLMGATMFMPPSICSHWTVNPSAAVPSMTVEAQCLVHLMGHFGISGPIDNLSQEAEQALRQAVGLYKRIRPLLAKAEIYHLTEFWTEGPQAALYLDRKTGHGLFFAFQLGSHFLKISLELPSHVRACALNLEHLAGSPNVGWESDGRLTVQFRVKGDAALWLLH